MTIHTTAFTPSDVHRDAIDFRGAMRQLAGGVSVITTGSGYQRTGLTVTSVTSLSADPATLIVCVNQNASSYPILKSFGSFGVNILPARLQAVAARFSGIGGLKGEERFTGADWFTLATGAPLLLGALAALDCTIEEIIERHSHAIVIGRVEATRIRSGEAPLGYWNGAYVSACHNEAVAFTPK